jgi:hypothetical protein
VAWFRELSSLAPQRMCLLVNVPFLRGGDLLSRALWKKQIPRSANSSEGRRK